MLVFKNAKICVTLNANAKICVTPNAKPQCESVEYRMRWVSWHWGSRWACTFHVVCVNFVCVGYPTQTQFSVNMGLKYLCSERSTWGIRPNMSASWIRHVKHNSKGTIQNSSPFPNQSVTVITLLYKPAKYVYMESRFAKWLYDILYGISYLHVF